MKNVTRLKVGGFLIAVSAVKDKDISQLANKAFQKYKDIDFFCNIKELKDIGLFHYKLRSQHGEAINFIKNNELNGGGRDNACGFKDKRGIVKILMDIEGLSW